MSAWSWRRLVAALFWMRASLLMTGILGEARCAVIGEGVAADKEEANVVGKQ